MVRHASWLLAVRAGEWTDAQTGVHSNLRGREGVKGTVKIRYISFGAVEVHARLDSILIFVTA